MDKKIFHFFDANGDLSKRWFIEWQEGAHRRRRYIAGETTEIRYEQYYVVLKKLSSQPAKPQKWWDKEKKRIAKFLEDNKPIWRKKTYQAAQAKFRQIEKYAALNPFADIDSLLDGFFVSSRQHLNPSTYNDYLVMFARLWKLPAHLKPLKANPIPARYFTGSQVRFLAKEIQERDADLWLFVQFIFYCFIRPQELRFLRVSDVILEERKIIVQGSISKNKKEQYVAIPDAFYPILEQNIEHRNPTHYIFVGRNKEEPISANVMSRRHQTILKELGFDTSKYKLYSWKHTGAVMATKAGIHIKQLQIQLRHHSLYQVNEYLRQLGVEDLKDLATKFPKI